MLTEGFCAYGISTKVYRFLGGDGVYDGTRFCRWFVVVLHVSIDPYWFSELCFNILMTQKMSQRQGVPIYVVHYGETIFFVKALTY